MDFTCGDVYQSSFDPKAYLASFRRFISGREGILKFRLQKLHDTFGPGGISGDLLIDIGSGPTLYQLLSACKSFSSIIATDFADQNREELEKWLRNDTEAFDWSEVVKTVCELEGKRDKSEEKQNNLRSRIQRVLKCDVTKSNPLDLVVVPPADCLITALCLECACKDLEVYHSAIRNITSLLKSGGHLVVIGALGCTFYRVGQKIFSCLLLNEELVRDAITQAGYTIIDMEIFPLPNPALHAHFTDLSDYFFLVAKQKLKN